MVDPKREKSKRYKTLDISTLSLKFQGNIENLVIRQLEVSHNTIPGVKNFILNLQDKNLTYILGWAAFLLAKGKKNKNKRKLNETNIIFLCDRVSIIQRVDHTQDPTSTPEKEHGAWWSTIGTLTSYLLYPLPSLSPILSGLHIQKTSPTGKIGMGSE